jgi:hypothetical protein
MALFALASQSSARHRLFAFCDHLQDLAPRRPVSSHCVPIGPQLQGLLHRQLLIDASLCDRHPLFQYDLEGRAYRVGQRTLLAPAALRVSTMAFLEPASPR